MPDIINAEIEHEPPVAIVFHGCSLKHKVRALIMERALDLTNVLTEVFVRLPIAVIP